MANPNGPGGVWTPVLDDGFSSTSNWNLCDGWTGQNGVTTHASNVSVSGGQCTLTLASSTSGAQMVLNASVYQMAVGDCIEAEINFPGSGGTCYNWPAWWATSTGSAWPAGGEADIFEVGGSSATINYHYGPSNSQAGPFPISGTWAGGLHTYTLWRQKTQLLVYWDGVLKETIPTHDTGVPWTLYLTHGYTSGHVLSAGAHMVVNYVRAWTPGSSGGGGGGTGGVAPGSAVTEVPVANRAITTYAKPTGVAAGDLMLLFHYSGASSASPPEGFTQIPLTSGSWPVSAGTDTFGNAYYVWGWKRVAGASEPTSYSVSGTTANTCGLLCYTTGNDTSNPITAAITNHGTGGTTTFSSVTTSVTNELLVAFQLDDQDTTNSYTPPSGFTTAYGTAPIWQGTTTQASAGASGSKTMSNNSSTGNPWVSVVVAVQPPGAPAPAHFTGALHATAALAAASATISTSNRVALSAKLGVLAGLSGVMGSEGTVGFPAGVREALQPWAPQGSDFDSLNVALASMFQTVYGIVADVGSPDQPDAYQAGWSVLLNPAACAAQYPQFLPWLALFVGAQVPIGAPGGIALNTILGEQGFARGQGFGGSYDSTTGAQGGPIVTAAQSQLTGNQNVTLIERTNASGNPDPYSFLLIVNPTQVVSLSALTAAVAAAKPGGVAFTIVQTSTWTIAQLEASYSTINSVESTFATITALEGDVT